MRISIVNITKRLQVDLLSTSSYIDTTGCNPNTWKYPILSEKTGYIHLLSTSGLVSGGSSVSNTTLKAINTNGEYFAGNSWGPTTFSIAFSALNDISFQRLNEAIKYKNEPLYIEVETDKTYYMWCIVDDGSGIESGELTFLSALDGVGTYWSSGREDYIWDLTVSGKALVQSGPQNILGGLVDKTSDEGYDVYTLQRFVVGEQSPIITVDGVETPFILEHVNTGTSYTDGGLGGSTYVFNSEDYTTTVDGTSADYTTDYIQLTGGDETFKFKVPTGTNVNDIRIKFNYERLHSTVFGG